MSTISLEQLHQRLTDFLQQQTGQSVTVTHTAPLAGGASRDMWRIDAQIDGVPQTFVLRRDLPTQMLDSALTRAQEFAIMRAAYDAGIKVARPRFLGDDPSILGGAFFLMDYVEGIAIGRKVVSAPDLAYAREVLPAQMAEQLALIHRLNPAEFSFLARPVQSAAQDAIDQTARTLEVLGIRSPVFAFCLHWAARHLPVESEPTFIHGDFRIGNLLVNAKGLVAVADWEFCHLGDPCEELGYLCMRDWRFGVGTLRMGGIAHRETFLQTYEAASGRAISRAAVDWWELMGNIRWAAISLSQANRHLSGREPSIELASLGRRSAEMQYESLKLIERMGA
ncbi:MAG: phosphotransferase family protein [Anaerolineae bacterium]